MHRLSWGHAVLNPGLCGNGAQRLPSMLLQMSCLQSWLPGAQISRLPGDLFG